MTTNDQITISESTILVLSPSIYQSNLGIVSGNTYKLQFDATTTTGVLKVYQGSQLIYSSGTVMIGNTGTLYESIILSERITLSIS